MRKLGPWRRTLAGVVGFCVPAAMVWSGASAAMAEYGASFFYGVVVWAATAALLVSAVSGQVPALGDGDDGAR